MTKQIEMFNRDELQDGQLIQFVGVHVLKWERLKREYGIPDWDFAFVTVDDEEE